MTIFESWHSSRAFARVGTVAIGQHGARPGGAHERLPVARFLDMAHRGVFGALAEPTETWLFALEIALMGCHLCYTSGRSDESGALYACVVMVLFGFIANRLNVPSPEWKPVRARTTFPNGRVAVTLSIVGAGLRFSVSSPSISDFRSAPHEEAPRKLEDGGRRSRSEMSLGKTIRLGWPPSWLSR